MSRGLDPNLMTPAERLDEIAEILAAGLVRLRRQQLGEPRPLEKKGLDFPTDRSVHATTRRRRRVS